MGLLDTSFLLAGVTLGVVALSVACALIAVRPAKAFAAIADLSSQERQRVCPRYPWNMLFYGWTAMIVLPWIASVAPQSMRPVWSVLGLVAVLSMVAAPMIYIVIWAKALYSQNLGRDLRRGLPFLIAGALLIEVFLGYRLVSSIRAFDPAFEKDGLVGGSYRDRETAL